MTNISHKYLKYMNTDEELKGNLLLIETKDDGDTRETFRVSRDLRLYKCILSKNQNILFFFFTFLDDFGLDDDGLGIINLTLSYF